MRSLIIALISAVMAVLTYIFMSKTWRDQHTLAGSKAGSGALASAGRRVGRRGAFLMFLVVLDAAYGYALLSAQVRALSGGPDFFLPLHAWGWIWIGVGAFLVTGIPARRDIVQYTAAALFKAVWGMLYADLWIVQHVSTAWVSVVVWLAFALTVLLIAGWPEPGPARELAEAHTPPDGIPAVADALRDVRAPQEEE